MTFLEVLTMPMMMPQNPEYSNKELFGIWLVVNQDVQEYSSLFHSSGST